MTSITISVTHCFAISRTSSRVRNPKGCGITVIGSIGLPKAFACARPSVVNAVEQTATAARLRFAISTLSWTLHDAHDPQSPDPVITRSHSSASSLTISSGAGTDADDFLRLMTRFTP